MSRSTHSLSVAVVTRSSLRQRTKDNTPPALDFIGRSDVGVRPGPAHCAPQLHRG